MRTRLSLLCVMLLTLLPTVAHAHTLGDTVKAASGPTFCLYESIILREDAAEFGFSRGRVRSYKPDCEQERNRPTAHLAQVFYVYFEKTEGGDGGVCMYSPFYYNDKPEWGFAVEMTLKGDAYCGPGWYRVHAYGFIWENQRWHNYDVAMTEWHHFS